MAVNLNLLPPEYGQAKGFGKVLKVTRALGVIGIAFFLVFTLGVSAFFIISSLSLRNTKDDLDSLKAQIANEEVSEQQMVLLKDRLAKIKGIYAKPDANGMLISVNPYITNLSANTTLTEMGVDTGKVELSLTFRSRPDLTTFLKKVEEGKEFKSVSLSSFTFSPEGGYLVSITAKK